VLRLQNLNPEMKASLKGEGKEKEKRTKEEIANAMERRRSKAKSDAGLRNLLSEHKRGKPIKDFDPDSNFDFYKVDDCFPTPTPSVVELLRKLDLEQRPSFNPFPTCKKTKPHAWDGMPCRRYPDEIRPHHQSQGNPGGRPFTQVVDFVAKPVIKTPKTDWSKVRRRHSSEWELDNTGHKKERPDPLKDPDLKPSVRYYMKEMVRTYPRLNKEVGYSRWCNIFERKPAFQDFLTKRCHHLLYDYRERFEAPKLKPPKNNHKPTPGMEPFVYVERPYRHWPFVSKTMYPSLVKLNAEMNGEGDQG